MLHLDRKKNQSVELYHKGTGQVIHVIVLDIQGKNVRLGFEDSTNSSTILRKEVRQRNEGKDNPNPFYDDRIPNYHKPKESLPDPLEALLDELIPNTEDSTSDPLYAPTPYELPDLPPPTAIPMNKGETTKAA